MMRRIVVIFILIGLLPCAKSQSLYPIISLATQRMRDDERRTILEDELQAEREMLAKARMAFDAESTKERETELHRHIEDVKALQRELDRSIEKQRPRKLARAVVKASRPAANTSIESGEDTPRFWDPYNRAPDNTDFLTAPRKETP